MSEISPNREKHLNFRLISVRVPYAIIWYFLYTGLDSVGAYAGAEDIEKCLAWLALFSLLVAFLVSYDLAP